MFARQSTIPPTQREQKLCRRQGCRPEESSIPLSYSLRFTNCNPQLPQLPLIHRRRRIHHQIHRARGLRERNHFAQTLRTRKNHHDAVKPKRNPSMRRRAILQRFEEESEALLRLFIGHAQRLENLRLNILTVNTNRPRAQLRAVQHDVVSQRPHRAERRLWIIHRIHALLEQAHVLFVRRRERMVRRHPLLLALVPLEHGKVRDPEEAVVLRRIARLLEDSVPVGILLRQRQPQQSRRCIDRQLRWCNFAVRRQRGLRPSLRRASDQNNQVTFFHRGL